MLMVFDEIKQQVIDLALLGASPSAIAYELNKGGMSIDASQVADLLKLWEHDIEMERELRKLHEQRQLGDIIRRLEALLALLEKLLTTAMEKNKSKVSVEAIKEMHAIISKIYALITEARAMEAAQKASSLGDFKSVYKYVVDNFHEIVQLIPDKKLEEAGLVRVSKSSEQTSGSRS